MRWTSSFSMVEVNSLKTSVREMYTESGAKPGPR